MLLFFKFLITTIDKHSKIIFNHKNVQLEIV